MYTNTHTKLHRHCLLPRPFVRLFIAFFALLAGGPSITLADDDAALVREQALYDQRRAELEQRCEAALADNLSPGEFSTYQSLDEHGRSDMLEDGLSTDMYEALIPECQEIVMGSLFFRTLRGPDTEQNVAAGMRWFMIMALRDYIEQLSYPLRHARQPNRYGLGALQLVISERWGRQLLENPELLQTAVQFALDWDRNHPSVINPPEVYPEAHAEARQYLVSSTQQLTQ